MRAQSHMKSVAVVALALLESAQAFQAGAAPMRTVSRAASPAMFKTGDIGARRLQLPPCTQVFRCCAHAVRLFVLSLSMLRTRTRGAAR